MSYEVTISPDVMQKIARYEMTFTSFFKGILDEQVTFKMPDEYQITIDDVYTALNNIYEANPSVDELLNDWFVPLMDAEDRFGIENARTFIDDEFDEDADDESEDEDEFDDDYGFDDDDDEFEDELDEEAELLVYAACMGLPVVDNALVDSVFNLFEDIRSDYEGNPDGYLEKKICEVVHLDLVIEDFKRYFENTTKPIMERKFHIDEKKTYVRCFKDDEILENVSQSAINLAKKFIEDLCDINDVEALNIKGYACYGGNRLYECDWKASRDCMEKLFKKTKDPQYANTLGYIYYYGRCTDGVPEYEKAFKNFSISAANGLFEGIYKLADMYYHGYGCDRNERTAASLYRMAYDFSSDIFVKGEHANLADTALRMGNVAAKGINCKINHVTAYRLYLLANYAAKLRAADSNFFGNISVVKTTEKVLEEIKQKLPKDFFKDSLTFDFMFIFSNLCDENNRCKLTRNLRPDGTLALTAMRIPTKSVPEPNSIVVIIEPLEFCERTTQFTLICEDPAKVHFEGNEDMIKYDYVEWNEDNMRYEFFYDEELVGWVESREFVVNRV